MSIARESVTFRLPSGFQVWPLDTGSSAARFVVEAPQGRHFEINTGVLELLELLRDRPLSHEDLTRALAERGVSEDETEAALRVIKTQLVPNGIVQSSAAELCVSPSRSSFLTYKLPLISAQALRPLTSVLRGLFHPALSIPVLVVSLAWHAYFYLGPFHVVPWSLLDVPLSSFAILMLVANLLWAFHELGHASACRYFDCPHGKIGWGIYLVFFVFYTDVSSTWRLRRAQRVVVDLGGIYFELLGALVLFALYMQERNPIWAYALIGVDLSILTSLNPFLRRDGYWLATDLLGQANLRDTSFTELWRFWQGEHRERSATSAREVRLRLIVVIYALLSLVFFLSLALWIGYRVFGVIGPALPGLAEHMAADFRRVPPDYRNGLETFFRLALAASFVVFSLLSAVRMITAFLRSGGNGRSDAGGQPSWEVKA